MTDAISRMIEGGICDHPLKETRARDGERVLWREFECSRCGYTLELTMAEDEDTLDAERECHRNC